MENLGIGNLKSELDLGLAIVSMMKQAKADGKVDAADLGLLLQLIPVVGPAAGGLSQVVPELKDLSEAEGIELVVYVMNKLTVEDEKARLIVEKGLKWAVASSELGKAITFEPAAPAA